MFKLHLKIPSLHQVEQASRYGHNRGLVISNVITLDRNLENMQKHIITIKINGTIWTDF